MGGTCPSGGVCAAGEVSCHPTGCGDGVPEGMEECDDGSLAVMDGCDASCRLEPQMPARAGCPAAPMQLAPIPGGRLGAVGFAATDTPTGTALGPYSPTSCPSDLMRAGVHYWVHVPPGSSMRVEGYARRAQTLRVFRGVCGSRTGAAVEVACAATLPGEFVIQLTTETSGLSGDYEIVQQAEYTGALGHDGAIRVYVTPP